MLGATADLSGSAGNTVGQADRGALQDQLDKAPERRPEPVKVLARYAEVRHRIGDGDLLLFRRGGPIAIAGRGEHAHAAKAAWWDDDLLCLEVTGWHGGRAVMLSHLVRRRPGRIDVFEVNPEGRWPHYDRQGAVRFMRRLCGCPYGYFGLIAAALLHLPVVRWFVRPNLDDEAIDRRPPFCSQACAMADRLGGGVDPVPRLADRLTEPADLARSPLYRYRFTLT
jgi:hypothetical protein